MNPWFIYLFYSNSPAAYSAVDGSSVGSNHAKTSFPVLVTIEGQYCYDNGETWSDIQPETDFSTENRSLLRVHYNSSMSEETMLNFLSQSYHNGDIPPVSNLLNLFRIKQPWKLCSNGSNADIRELLAMIALFSSIISMYSGYDWLALERFFNSNCGGRKFQLFCWSVAHSENGIIKPFVRAAVLRRLHRRGEYICQFVISEVGVGHKWRIFYP